MPIKKNIDAIIFDLGKVIVETNLEKTFSEFQRMRNEPHLFVNNFFENEHVKLFELGKISDQEFFSNMKDYLYLNNDSNFIEHAWNAMITGISSESIKLLRELKKELPLYALSNTNVSHVKAINNKLLYNHQIKDIRELFDKIYFSHELGLGKPDKKIFEHVLIDLKIPQNRLLFIDDNGENIRVAKEIGFQTIHLLEQSKLAEKLKRVGVLSNEN